MTGRAGDHHLCGWRVRSEWPLPELRPWTGDDRPADITIRLGTVPAELPGGVRKNPLVQVNDRNWLRYTVRNVADYLVRDGSEVIIDTPHPTGTPDVALFLLGSVLGFLCHQRGLLPLHASCMSIDGRVVAFAGQSGSGKSTMAALFLAQGAQLLSDDVTVIDVHAEGGPVMLPSFPRQKLWRDTLDAFGITPGRYLRSTVDLEKFDRPVTASFTATPQRLDGIYQMHPRMREGAPRLAPLDGLPAVRMLYENVYRRTAGALLGHSDRIFQHCTLLARALPIQALVLPDGIDAVSRMGPDLGQLLAEAR